MKKYDFCQDEKISMWQRHHFSVMAESEQEAEQIILQRGLATKSVDEVADGTQIIFDCTKDLLDTRSRIDAHRNDGFDTLAILTVDGEKREICSNDITHTEEFSKVNLSMAELVSAVHQLGQNGGGAVEVTGTWRGKPCTICVEQTGWHGTPVCLVGGNGHEVSVIHPQNVSGLLYCVIGNYLDGETFSVKGL